METWKKIMTASALMLILAFSTFAIGSAEAQDGDSGGGSDQYFDTQVSSEYLIIEENTLKGLNIEKMIETYPNYSSDNCLRVGIVVPGNITKLDQSLSDDQSEVYPITSITFETGSQLKEIVKELFRSEKYLQYIEIPESVTKIADMAFYSCISLKKVILPSGLTSLGNSSGGAFRNCSSLESVLVRDDEHTTGCVIPNGVTTIPGNTFSGCSSMAGDLILPSGLTGLQTSAFNGCKSLTAVLIDGDVHTSGINLPNSLKTIPLQLFKNCSSLKGELVIPNSVKTIEQSAFSGCTGITGVVLNDGLESLGTKSEGAVFNECSGIKYIRTSSEDAVFELPSTLKIIGRQSFKGCSGFPDDTMVVLSDNIEYVGQEAFYNTSQIDTIVVKASDTSAYNSEAFKASEFRYGVGDRITIFTQYSGWQTFTRSITGGYGKSLTYEFILHYGDSGAGGEPKLYNQALNVVRTDEYTWYIDEDYTMPEADGSASAPIGYQPGGWMYDNRLLDSTTVLRPSGTELVVQTGFELVEPTVEFIVDGEAVENEDSHIDLVVPNDGAMIGVNVTHPLYDSGVRDENGGYVKFRYLWVDVWKGGFEGPRTISGEDGFTKPGFFNDGTPMISIEGPRHERLINGNYSEKDYGRGYYLLIIYGLYYEPNKAAVTFYQSANTVIGSDSDRTTDMSYIFYVKTTAPAEEPVISVEDLNVDYGYSEDKSRFSVDFTEIDGQSYIIQWYDDDGEPISGADESEFNPGTGLGVGTYDYSVTVTTIKIDNNDKITVTKNVQLTVNPLNVLVTPTEGQYKYTGQDDPTFLFSLSREIETSGKLSRTSGEDPRTYGFIIGTLESTDDNYKLVLAGEVTFEVVQYEAAPVISPGEPDGSNGWYVSEVVINPPEGHVISTDGGNTWSEGPISYDEMDDDISILVKSVTEDDSFGAVSVTEIELKIDRTAPVIIGIASDDTKCIETSFEIEETNLAAVTVDGTTIQPSDGKYILESGIHTVIASDMAGNTVTVQIVVNADHTFGELVVDKEPTCTETGSGHRDCAYCDAVSNESIDALGHEFGEWVTVEEPTQFEYGYAVRECSRCDETETEIIPAIGMTYPPYIPPDDDDWIPVYPGGGGGGTADDDITNYPNTGGLTDEELSVLLMTLAIICALFAIFLLILAKRRKDDEEDERS